jgi:hypothetical protein
MWKLAKRVNISSKLRPHIYYSVSQVKLLYSSAGAGRHEEEEEEELEEPDQE